MGRAGYVRQSHTIYIAPETIEKLAGNLNEVMAHEGTHGTLSALRTRLKLTEPQLFAEMALAGIMEDTLRGDKRMIAMGAINEGTPQVQLILTRKTLYPFAGIQGKSGLFFKGCD